MNACLQGAGRLRAGATALALAALLALLALAAPPRADGAVLRLPKATYLSHAQGRLVPIPASIPHQEGAYIDRRLIPNLRVINRRFHIYITEGYAGRLPSGRVVGCPSCHVANSDHFTGLALDIAAPSFSTTCDGTWRRISALARWAEPRPDVVRPPFRWVGYDGDSGHGCGHHLHLSWNAAPTRSFSTASWVEVFKVRNRVSPEARLRDLRPSGGSEAMPVLSVSPSGGFSPR